MSHLKYTTPAFVISSSSFGEADKTIFFYTKDFGMIGALAKSVRLLKSKLKHALEDGNFLSISMVRGRDIWRLTDAVVEEKISTQSKEFALFLKIIKLLKGLVQGEEKNENLFSHLEEVFETLSKKKFKEEDLDSLECLTVLRVLDSLGYGRRGELGIPIFDPVEAPLLETIKNNKKIVIDLINRSIRESHLS